MKHKFNTAVVTADTIQAGTDDFKNPIFVFAEMNESEQKIYNDFLLLVDKKCSEVMEQIEIPSEECDYVMIKPCPVDENLTVKIYERGVKTDKDKKEITFTILALHFDSEGNRVPQWDGYSYVMADMSEDRKVQVDENTSFYSYDLAISMIENGDSVSSLVTKAIQLADLDGSLNKRLYEL